MKIMPMSEMASHTNPPDDCTLCPRLVEFRNANQALYPDWHNGPVHSFGPTDAQLLIVGLAPGLKGANRTGRPFTGDFAGDLLYDTMIKFGFAEGEYRADPNDGLTLTGSMVTNAVRCLPPQNKPVGAEIAECRPYLLAQIMAMGNLKAILALGHIAHVTTLSALNLKRSAFKFGHGARHDVSSAFDKGDAPLLFNSYHCSRYNTNTRRLTEAMFHDVFADIRSVI